MRLICPHSGAKLISIMNFPLRYRLGPAYWVIQDTLVAAILPEPLDLNIDSLMTADFGLPSRLFLKMSGNGPDKLA
jgi:hypothetical protein